MVMLSRSLGKQAYFSYAEILGCRSALLVRALQPHAWNLPDLALGPGHGAMPRIVVGIIDVVQADHR